MTAIDPAGYISYVDVSGHSRSGSEGMAYLERMLARSKEAPGGEDVKPASQISGDTFSLSDSYCRFLIDTEGLAASDNLYTISAGAGTLHPGQIVGLSLNSAARLVTVKNTNGVTGNIKTINGRDLVLRDKNQIFWAMWSPGDSTFYQVWPDNSLAMDRIAGRKAIATATVAGGIASWASLAATSPISYLSATGAQNLDQIASDGFLDDEANLLYLTPASGSGAITVRHNVAGSGNNLKIFLQDATNFVLAPGMTLVVRKESTQFTEVGRMQATPPSAQGVIAVGNASAWSSLAAPANNQMKLASATGAAQKMAWALDPFAGYRVLTPASNPQTYNLGLYDESWMSLDLTTGGAIINLPDFVSSFGKEWSFYLAVNPSGRTVTINCPTGGNTMGKNALTSIQLSTVGDLVCIQTDGTANAKITIDSRSTVVKPTSMGKLKNVDQGTYQSASVMMSNGSIVQAGLSIGLARGSVDGINQFGPVEWEPINPPPAGTSIVDWVFTGSNLFVVLSNGWVYAAGQNAGGQLGQGDTTARYVLTRIPYFFNNSITVNKVFAASNGQVDATMASVYFYVSAAGINYVFACGNNAGGQLGNGNTTNQLTPVNVMNMGTNTLVDLQISITAYANAYAAILRSDGNVYMCGNNVAGALGQGNTTALTAFTAVPGISNATAVKLYGGNNGATFCQTTAILTSASSGSLFVFGYNASYQGANGATTNKTSPGTAILTNVKDFGFCGGTISYGCYALKNDGTFFTWGEGANNILFGASTTTIQTPTQKFTGTVVKAWSFVFGASVTLPAIGLIVLDSVGKLHISGTATTSMPFPVLQNTNYASGAYLAALPKELTDGTDSISDIYVFNNAGVNPMAFILTTNGAIYAGGGGAATAAPLCKGHVVTTTTEATNVYLYRLNKHLWE